MAYTRSLSIDVPDSAHALETRILLPATRLGSPAESHALSSRNVLIAPPHPLYGGSIENPVVETLEQAFCARGFGALSFNYRGVGESGGAQRGDLGEALCDLLAVARAPEAQPLSALAGYSFGACVALRAAFTIPVGQLVLIAPALGLFDPELMRTYSGRLVLVVGSDDSYAPHAALRELLPSAADVRFQVLAGADHFFSGSQLPRLSAALSELIG